ncbi:MAG: NAD-dependent epimerase/dehydratase family protein [Bacteroidales bacterium]|nr:NAD-dependent epimerase/dehydratase family protein [Bacteroidales bacterium]
MAFAQSHPRTLAPSHPRSVVSVEIWGSGSPLREFLWSEDMADACVFIMENVNFNDLIPQPAALSLSKGQPQPQPEIRNTHINIGTGKEISIKQLAELVREIVHFKGELYFNTSKPDGTLRKLTDPSKLDALGWKHSVEIEDGINLIYNWYQKN